MSTSKKSVVVVGGGAAGSAIARSLSSKLNAAEHTLTLINNRPFIIPLPTTIRLTVSSIEADADLESRVLIPYDRLFPGIGEFKLGTVTAIEPASKGPGHVVLASGERLPFDFLVLALGSTWPSLLAFPDTKESVHEWIEESKHKFKGVKSVLLVGGGAIGAEYSGEIKDSYPDMKVTIVHGNDHLLNDAYPLKYRTALEASVRARGVELVLGDRIDEFPTSPSTVTTKNGKTINADLILQTTGGKPQTSVVATLPGKTLTDAGYVKVKPTLQLEEYPNILAAGDIIEWVEQKQAIKSAAHAGVVVANTVSLLAGQAPTAEYKGSREMIVITNGREGGKSYFGVLWGIVLGDWFTKLVKSKGLLIPMFRSGAGYDS